MVWWATVAMAAPGDGLPVTRVRVYETGIAWFEREGEVDRSTALELPQSHLDDALKSLVILGGDAEVGAVTFPAARSDRAARTLAGLPATGTLSFADGLRTLLGRPVSVRTVDGRSLGGTLLSVERVAYVGGDEGPRVPELPEHTIGLLTSRGALLRLLASEIVEVRSLAPDQRRRLRDATRSLDTVRAQQPRELVIDVARGGSLAVGYLAEAPVWRVSYRLVADDDDARLQAWALVHNDTDEDWEGVTIEVANGQPRSFLYPLAAPRYPRRDLVVPDTPLSTVPQLAAQSPDSLWDETEREGLTVESSLIGLGSGSGGFAVGGGGGSGRLADLPAAEPVDTPTQFVVQVARPVDLRAQHSALLPLGTDEVTAKRIVAFAPRSTQARTAVWLRNDTRRTLPAGVVAVLAGGGLSGETQFDRTKPDEAQMLLVGDELDVDLDRRSTTAPARTEAIAFENGNWRVTTREEQRVRFDLRNRSGRPQQLWAAFEVDRYSTVAGDRPTVIDPQRGWTWVVLDGAPGPSEQEIVIERARTVSTKPEEVTAETYLAWANARLAEPGPLRRAAAVRERLAEVEGTRREVDAEATRLGEAIQGLREDLEAASGGGDAKALVKRIAKLGGALQTLRERQAALADDRTIMVRTLNEELVNL